MPEIILEKTFFIPRAEVLICTLFRDSEFYLDKYLGSLGKLIDYSAGNGYRINLCFIEGNSADNTYRKLDRWLHTCKCDYTLHKHDIDPQMSKYQRLAMLRNMALELGSADRYDYVLMIDSDISFKQDLLERLVVSLERTDGVLIAPMIYVEDTEAFHDILAFVKDGKNFVNLYPYHTALEQYSGIVEMDSVGDCFFARADVIKDVRFEGDRQSEMIGFCKNIRKKGGKIYIDKRIAAYHADLPKYGLSWH